MNFSLKKYLQISLFWFGNATILGLMIVFCQLILPDDSSTILTILCAVIGSIELLVGVYNLSNFFDFKKNCEKYTPIEGVIQNWSLGMPRGFASVSVKVDEQEYSSGSYFNYWECSDMVGKRVKYTIIDDVLFLYEILD